MNNGQVKLSTLVAAAVVTTTLVSSIAEAQIRYVDDDAPSNGDGTSWTTAYRYLRDALANAVGITELRVAQGIYRPDRDEVNRFGTGDRTATFQLISGVALRGGYAGAVAPDPDARDIDLYETILSGDLLGDDGPDFENNDENSLHIVTGTGADATAVLDGFTLTAGNADGSLGFPSSRGGAFSLNGGTPSIRDCTFHSNFASFDGGAFFMLTGEPTITHCKFIENSSSYAGGLSVCDASPTVVGCVFRENTAFIGGGAVYTERASSGTFLNCLFEANSALECGPFAGGGGIHNNYDSMTILINCVFIENLAACGGAMANRFDFFGEPSRPLVFGCSFVGNSASEFGGALFNKASHPTVINCTFVRNDAAVTGGGMYSSSISNPTVTNCVLWDDSTQEIVDTSGSATTVSHSDVLGGWTGSGSNNLDADPLFVDADGPDDDPETLGDNDYRLGPGSPCIDAADNTTVPEDITTDLDGNPRFVDDPSTPDTGNGDPPIVDMGAYEFQGLPCPWDLNGDGIVNVLDLIQLVMSFGPCEGCPADINDDGIVNVLDLIALIMNFGPCPGTPCVWDVNGDGIVDQSDLQQILDNFGPCDGCPEDVNGDGVVNGQDVAAVATHFGPCPQPAAPTRSTARER